MRMTVLAGLSALCLAASAQAAPIDAFTYKDEAALDAAWKPGNADSGSPSLRSQEATKYARFELPYSKLKDWRFSWDLQGRWDLEPAERIVLKMRAGASAAPGQVLVYFHSGEGWYVLPAFSLGPQWREISLEKSQAKQEGKAGGWDKVDAVRVSFMPGQGGDSSADLARVEGQGPLPERWVWQVGGAKDKEQCFTRILNRATGQAYTDARKRLSAADGILSHARADGLHGEERKQALFDARAKVAEAYALSQAPLKPGLRGAWVHHGDGPRGPDGTRGARWKDAIPELHSLGFNAVVPNLLWSGVAFYPSKLVPNAPNLAFEIDSLQEILDAAKPLGMQVHVWKVMWQFGEGWVAPVGVSQPFKDAGRMQKDVHGKETGWLCPCDERNRKYELDALLEVAKYPIDGVHLDYIRFEGPEAGYGDACKKRFEAWSGKTVAHWPADCAPGATLGEAYGDFKRELISSFVQEASQKLRAAHPGIQLSAAVFSYPDLARKQVFQDWPRWVKEGWLDFVCPMTYTEDAESFAGATQAQAAIVGADKLRPGIQVVHDQGRALALESLVDQLKAAERIGAPGATLFEWREGLLDRTLPYIRAGLWREGKYELKLPAGAEKPKGPTVTPGLKLKPKGKGKKKRLGIDSFNDGDLTNELGGVWWSEQDSNKLGTLLLDQPLHLSATARGNVLGLRGHFGKNQAPWSSALLSTGFNSANKPVDLRKFHRLCFWARGDGGPLDVYLRRAVVTDYSDFRLSVQPGAEWQRFELKLDDFAQPSWAQPVPKGFADVTYLQFQPGGRDDADFWFQIDDVELR